MWPIPLALLAVIIALWLSWRWKKTSTFAKLNIPGPKPSIWFGNTVELYKKGPVKCHQEWIEKYGRVLGYYYGMKPVLLVADPQLLKRIFIKDFPKFVDRASFNPLLPRNITDESSQSITNLTGHKWKEVRSVLTPNFSTAKMKKMSSTINSSIELMIDIMRGKAKSQEEFNIHDSFQRLTMDVISRTAFGVLIDVQTNPNSKALGASKIVFSTDFKDLFVLFLMCFPSLNWIGRKLQTFYFSLRNRGSDPFQMLRKGIATVIDIRRKHPESRKPDLLQMLLDTKINSAKPAEVNVSKLEAGGENDMEEVEPKKDAEFGQKNISDKMVVASSTTVFLAGYETTSTALAFTSYLLGKYPDVQNKIFEEIKELIASGEKLEYASVNKLPYLEKVLNESMRIYPPVYLFVSRYAMEDVKYESLRIPCGMQIIAPVYFLHHDAEYWTDPDTFDPERFNSKPNTDGINYLPFGIGPRNCMGMRFAQMEAKLVLAHMIYNFHLKISPSQRDNLPVSMKIQTLSPTDGVKAILKPRDQETQV